MGIHSNPAEIVAIGNSSKGDVGSRLPSGDRNATDAMMLRQLQLVGEAMAKIESSIMNMILNKADYQQQAATALVQQAGVFLNQAEQQVNKIVAELAKQKTESFWEHLFGYIVTALCVLLGSPELAIVTLALFAASESGGLKDLAGLIGKKLQEDGCSKKVADILSDLIVVVICSVAAAGASKGIGMAMEDASAAETATTATVVVSEVVAEATTNAAVDSSSAAANSAAGSMADAAADSTADAGEQSFSSQFGEKLGKLVKLLAKLNPAKNLSTTQAMALLAGSSAAMDTGLASNIADEAASAVSNKKDKKALKTLIEVLLNLVLVVASMGSMSTVASKTTSMMKLVSALKNSSLCSAENSDRLFQLWQTMQTVTQVGDGATQAVMASTQFTLASAIKEQGKDQAMSSFYSEIIEVLDNQAAATTKVLNGLESQVARELVGAADGLSKVNLMAARELSA